MKYSSYALLLLIVTHQAASVSGQSVSRQGADSLVAVVGATVIDGNGGAALPDATVLIRGKRIGSVGPRASVTVPAGAKVIDATGKFVTPGFIDTNVHVTMYGGGGPYLDWHETLARYQPRTADVTLEAAQLHLKYGITTIRDSYGQLLALVEVRDRIARGEVIGPRVLAAGNIVGWGGPYSVSFSLTRESGLTLFQEQVNDLITQGSGEDLMDMTPAELRVAINKYLDKGPNFIKFGGTSHSNNPVFIGFSHDAQKLMVDETHKRGLVAETHSTSIEGLRISVLAGVDLIQHPEYLVPREIPDDLVRLIRERNVICSILANTITGPAWRDYLKQKDALEKKKAEGGQQRTAEEREREWAKQGTAFHRPREKTAAERRQAHREAGLDIEIRRRNAEKLIKGGCLTTPSTDNYVGAAPEFRRDPKALWQDSGTGSIYAIEGLVELGMTPAQAIVAATRNGAIACRMEKELGTIEAGKLADLVLLDGNPLDDITNIRKLYRVIKEGRVVDPASLPTSPVWYRKESSATAPGTPARDEPGPR